MIDVRLVETLKRSDYGDKKWITEPNHASKQVYIYIYNINYYTKDIIKFVRKELTKQFVKWKN